MKTICKGRIWRQAFRRSLPVLCGYLFLGVAFGLLLQQAGYGPGWALLISLTVYAGSLQFALVGFLTGGASLGLVALMTLLINSRHLFYGLSFIRDFSAMKRRKWYMIFALTDETYSLLLPIREYPEEEKYPLMWAVAVLDHAYWVAGSVLGGLVGGALQANFTGIDFAMTALFVVILTEQCRRAANRFPALLGGICGLLALILLGQQNFLLPALVAVTGLLLAFRPLMGDKNGQGGEAS